MSWVRFNFWVLGVVIVAIMAMWGIDISVSTMINFGDKGYLTNGFWISDPNQIFHISLYLLLICIIILSFFTMRKESEVKK